MTTPAAVVLGGLVGAVIGVMWGDPYRNSMGRYTTRKSGYKSWIFQAIAGGILGAIITTAAVPLALANPIFALLLIGGITYGVYRTKVDPR